MSTIAVSEILFDEHRTSLGEADPALVSFRAD